MSALGFEEYVEPLKMYLHKYREVTSTLRPRAMQQLATHADCFGDFAGRESFIGKARSGCQWLEEGRGSITVTHVHGETHASCMHTRLLVCYDRKQEATNMQLHVLQGLPQSMLHYGGLPPQ